MSVGLSVPLVPLIGRFMLSDLLKCKVALTARLRLYTRIDSCAKVKHYSHDWAKVKHCSHLKSPIRKNPLWVLPTLSRLREKMPMYAQLLY